MDNKQETWREIPGFPGYEASDWGRVRSFKKRVGSAGGWKIADEPQRVLRPSTGRGSPYRIVQLCVDGETCARRVGVLVLLAFVGEAPDGHEVCHCNGDPTDDRLENLRWDTHAANMRDAVEHGSYGLTPDQVVDMRERYAAGENTDALVAEFGVTRPTIYAICTGKSYASLPGPITHRYCSVPDETIDQIRHRHLKMGETQRALADEFGLHYSTVSLYCSGKRRAVANA